jgi:saccharopine dehydrogenase-like NADP-dependent oxidoreductase
LGVGAVGSVAADLLANSEEFDRVVLADYDIEKAKSMEKRISNDKVESIRLDATDTEGMAKAFKGVDIVVNAVVPRFNFHIMDACLMAKASYTDMASDIFLSKEKVGEVVKEPPMQYQARKYSEAYEKAGIVGMLGMGCDPGAVNVFARMAADRMDRVKEMLVRDGDNGYVEGYEFAPLWSPETLIEEVLMPPMIYKDGAYRKVKPWSGKEMFSFPDPVGTLPIYNVDHEEQETLPTYIGEVLGKGCDYCDFKIALGDEYVEAIKTFGRIGLDNPEKIDVKGVKVAPRDVVTACLPDPATIGDRAKGDLAHGTITKGTKDGKDVGYYIYTSMNHQDCWNKYHHSATAYTVGVPVAIGAILFAQGKVDQKGVFPPEMLDPQPFVDMLPKYGMNCIVKKL